jgi:hypothetical protein
MDWAYFMQHWFIVVKDIRVLKVPAIIIERQLGHFEKVHEENAVDKTIEKRPDQPGGHFIYPPGSDSLHHADIIFLQSVR